MENDAIRAAVRERYGRIAEEVEERCCETSCCGGAGEANLKSRSSSLGYADDQLEQIPEGADLGLGSGNPIVRAELQEGDTVLDLGSGGGIDCFLAAKAVGPSGTVIGVDMTPEMVTKARANARAAGYENVDFRLGEIESLPVADGSVDVVISNCVLNLSPERDRALAEARRVLKPGGRLVISDMVSDQPVPSHLQKDTEAFTACLPVEREAFESQVREAGFVDVTIRDSRADAPQRSDSPPAFPDSIRGVIIEARRA